MSSKAIPLTVWLELTPTVEQRFSRDAGGYVPKVTALRATALYQKKPSKPNIQFIKLKIYVPEEVFLPFTPEAIINVPADMVESTITVEAINP